MTRTFVAIGLPDATLESLARIGESVPAGRALDEGGLHLTLAFLGDLDTAGLEEVHEALSAIRAPGFSIALEGIGIFGGARPRSLWAGVRHTPDLSHLQSKVARAVRGAGVDFARRKFVPHITLARFSGSGETPELQRFIAANAGLTMGPIRVEKFGMFASHLGRGGAVYEEMASYPLAPA